MFPHNVSFIACEIDRERYEMVENIRLIEMAQQQPDYREGIVRKGINWLGRRMVHWGAKLQTPEQVADFVFEKS